MHLCISGMKSPILAECDIASYDEPQNIEKLPARSAISGFMLCELPASQRTFDTAAAKMPELACAGHRLA